MAENLEDIIEIAGRLIESYKLDEANDYLNSAIDQYPESPDLYDLRGISWFRSLQVDEAIKDFTTALAVDNSYHLAYLHLAEVAMQKNNFKEAETFVRKAIEIEPENEHYQLNLAFVLLQLKDFENCLQVCNKMLGKNSKELTALEYRAICYLDLKRYESAAIDFETVCINSNDNPILYNNTGYSYSKIGNIEKAKRYLARAIQLDPLFSYPYDNLGYVYMLEKNYEKAHELIDKSIELDPSNSYAYKNKALVYIAENDNSNARKSLEKAKLLKFASYYGDEVDELLNNLNGNNQ